MIHRIQTLTRRELLERGAAAAGLLLGASGPSDAAGRGLRRAAPESLGVDPKGILGFVEAVNTSVGGLHSLMLLRHGAVAAEGWWNPYAPEYRHMLFSLSKSFTSTAVGLAVTEGKLTVDSPVTSFFPGELPAKVDDNLAAMRVRHLLTMNTGHDKDATGPVVSSADGNWVKAFLALPVEHAPGSKFVYNSAATYMLSAIVQKLTGQTVLDFLKPRLFSLLGISGITWETCPGGINTGGWGLSVKTEDIARFGQLYLQKGQWNGRRLIPESWVAEATSKQVSNGDPATGGDWNQGYGYQFWRCRHNNYRGDGAFGQYCIVMPAHDAVLAITSGVGDMAAVMNAAWDHLLPAMSAASPPPSAEFKQRLSRLGVEPVISGPTFGLASRVSGKTYRFEANPQTIRSLRLDSKGARAVLHVETESGEQKIECGSGAWIRGSAALHIQPPTFLRIPEQRRIAASGAWTAEDTYTAKICFTETPFILTANLRFTDNKLELRSKANVGFGPTDWPPLIGSVAS